MKKILLLLMICLLFGLNISAQNNFTKSNIMMHNNDTNASKDSTEYELIIFEPGFHSWFATNRKPIWYYSNEYYKYWDYLYTIYWNINYLSYHYMNRGKINPYNCYIDYNYYTDYGIKLNFKLYYYFKYVEYKYDVNIIPLRNTFNGIHTM